MASCYSCGHEFPESMAVYRSTLCPACGKDVKVCLNCRFYDPGAHWDCRETINEMVADKERANFCEFFVLAAAARPRATGKGTDEARARFDDLFGNG